MKIIISHDVDHLDASDHLFRDLILEKLWVRSFLHLCQGRISLKTFFHRLTILFHNRMNRIEEVMEFDRAHGIPSVFFFGMDNVLGMSYPRKKAAPVIRHVLEQGFDAGVHGVDYQDGEKSKRSMMHSGIFPVCSSLVCAIITCVLRMLPLKKWSRLAISLIPPGSISRSWKSVPPTRWGICGNFLCTSWMAIFAIRADWNRDCRIHSPQSAKRKLWACPIVPFCSTIISLTTVLIRS